MKRRLGGTLAFSAVLAALCAGTQIGPPAQAADLFALMIEMEGPGTGTVECQVGEGPIEACDAAYPEGTELMLIASEDPDSEFAGFSGDCGPDECELTMDGPKSVTATFDTVTQYSLTLRLRGTGSGTVECQAGSGPFEPCKAAYPEGTELTLAAEPDSNSEFERFSGDCKEEECELTMDEPHTVSVFFVLIPPIPQYSLTVIKKGTGSGTVLCEAQEGPEECQAKYPDETELALLQEAAPGSEFAGWSGAGCSGTGACEFTMTASKSVTATFNLIPRTLSVTTAGTGTGTIQCKFNGGSAGACTSPKPNGTSVEIIATPNAGSEFAGFSGGTGSASACSTSPCSFTLNANSSVTATFNLIPRTLSVTTAGTGTGTIQCKFNGGSAGACTSPQPNGTSVQIIATPNAGSTFAGFSIGTGSASSCTTSPCSFTITANSSATATFNLIPPAESTLTITQAGTGTGTIQCKFNGGSAGACTSPKPNGTTVEIIATANSGSEFTGFSSGTGSIGCTGTGNCSFTLNANSSVTATFNLIPPGFEYPLTVERLGTGSGTVTSSPAGIDCGSDCTEPFLEGTKVTLTATPAPGSVFDRWTGGGCAGSGACTTTMSTPRTAKAVFTAVGQRTLTISRTGTGKGTVTSSPAGIDCGQACAVGFGVGTKVTLTPTAATGSRFAGFSGACAGTGSCRVTLDQAREVTAAFEKVPNGVVRAAATAKVKAGKAMLKVSCAGGGACKGKLKLLARIGRGGKRVTIGTASFSVASDASRTLQIGLVRKAKQMLGHRETGLAARVSGTGVKGRQVRLKNA